jgi:hypothetical protein
MYLIRGIQIHALWIYNTLRIRGYRTLPSDNLNFSKRMVKISFIWTVFEECSICSVPEFSTFWSENCGNLSSLPPHTIVDVSLATTATD